ncbi:MAG: hypothetical protein JWN40_3839 [Phycisphaerales bacterium]|nr:hypothetical protein [Phycisphaerales bacterium]
MNSEPPPLTPPPKELSVTFASLVDLGVEHWRLSTWLAGIAAAGGAGAGGGATALPRHALRRMDDFLKACSLEVRGLDGQAFDVGMAARVLDAVDDPTLAEGSAVVVETVAPMVLWRGQVVRVADVVTRRGGKGDKANAGV